MRYEVCQDTEDGASTEVHDSSRELEDAIVLAEQFVSTAGGRIVVIDTEIGRVVWESQPA